MKCHIIKYDSVEYRKMIDLRYKILREPIGLTFTDKDLEKDKTDILCVTEFESKIIACCILSPLSEIDIQLRQMAVDGDFQGRNIGTSLLSFAEITAKEKGFSKLILHARKVAVGFYIKTGYDIAGDEFTEVGIPHFNMEKKLK